MTTPSRLHYTNMEGKEPHWEVDHYGQISIPSPIPVFPKPIALSYRNLYEQFGNHVFEETTDEGVPEHPRAFASYVFMSNLLHHYFTQPKYQVEQLWPGEEIDGKFEYASLVRTVPVMGTRYLAVQRKMEGKAGYEMVAMVIIVTDPTFYLHNARNQLTRLRFAANYIGPSGRFSFQNNHTMSMGKVVILAATANPIKPTFEFYDFDMNQTGRGELVPWISNSMKNTHGASTNIISLAPMYAPVVDLMFKAIGKDATTDPDTVSKGLSATPPVASGVAGTSVKHTATEQPELPVPNDPKRIKTDGQSSPSVPEVVPTSPLSDTSSLTEISSLSDEAPSSPIVRRSQRVRRIRKTS